jgi:hypothetical protein
MDENWEDLFAVLEDGVGEDDVEDVEPTPDEVRAAYASALGALHIPENALRFISPCFCLKADVSGDGGPIYHAFLHHVRFITFED